MFFTGAFIMLLGIIWARFFRHWVKTEGIIVRPTKAKPIKKNLLTGSKPIAMKNAHFQYTVDGVKYVKQSAIEQTPLPKPGKVVKVLYHPDKPERAMLNSILLNGGILKLIGGIFFGVSLIIYTIIR